MIMDRSLFPQNPSGSPEFNVLLLLTGFDKERKRQLLFHITQMEVEAWRCQELSPESS
jgi:hypothetical protein